MITLSTEKQGTFLLQENDNQGGGFAIGLERLVMALTGCENLHQTVAFPEFYKREHFLR